MRGGRGHFGVKRSAFELTERIESPQDEKIKVVAALLSLRGAEWSLVHFSSCDGLYILPIIRIYNAKMYRNLIHLTSQSLKVYVQ